MLVTLTVLCVVVAMISPSLVSMKATSERKSTISGVRRLAATARERAVSTGTATQVIYVEGTKRFEIQDLADDGTATSALFVELLDRVEPQRLQIQGKDVATDDFKMTFSPDGHSSGGGIDFKDFSILVDTNGTSQFMTGPLPETNDQVWQAGNLEQRN